MTGKDAAAARTGSTRKARTPPGAASGRPNPANVAGRATSTLVTGAGGVVGGWLVKALLGRGERVVLLRRGDAGPRSALGLEGTEARCAVVHGDLLGDPGALDRLLAEHEVECVFHLAGQSIVSVAREDPVATFEANVRGTWLLLDACRRRGVGRVVVASSDKVYGPLGEQPFDEARCLDARFPYAVSKAAADLIARSFAHTYGLPVATARLTNVYGGGDLRASRLVPGAIADALAGRRPVVRSDGTPERDMLYAQDAAAAYLAIADALADPAGGARGAAFNAGSGSPRPVLEIVRLVCEAVGGDLRPDVRGTGTPEGEHHREAVDLRRLRAATGWSAAVGLEEGLRRTVAWYREHPAALGI